MISKTTLCSCRSGNEAKCVYTWSGKFTIRTWYGTEHDTSHSIGILNNSAKYTWRLTMQTTRNHAGFRVVYYLYRNCSPTPPNIIVQKCTGRKIFTRALRAIIMFSPQGLTNHASIILGIIGGFSSTSIIGNNRRPNWHNFGGTTIKMNFQLGQRRVNWFCYIINPPQLQLNRCSHFYRELIFSQAKHMYVIGRLHISFSNNNA